MEFVNQIKHWNQFINIIPDSIYTQFGCFPISYKGNKNIVVHCINENCFGCRCLCCCCQKNPFVRIIDDKM